MLKARKEAKELLKEMDLKIKMYRLHLKLVSSRKWEYILSKYPNFMKLDYNIAKSLVVWEQLEKRLEKTKAKALKAKVPNSIKEKVARDMDRNIERARETRAKLIKKHKIKVSK